MKVVDYFWAKVDVSYGLRDKGAKEGLKLNSKRDSNRSLTRFWTVALN